MFVERSRMEIYTNKDILLFISRATLHPSPLLCAMTCMACITGSPTIWLHLALANKESWQEIRGRENNHAGCYSLAFSPWIHWGWLHTLIKGPSSCQVALLHSPF